MSAVHPYFRNTKVDIHKYSILIPSACDIYFMYVT